jgi:hypothetical protein
MGERTRKPGEAGFGIAGKPGSVSDPDPGGADHTISYHRSFLRVPGQDPVTAYPADAFAGDANSFTCYTKSNQDFENYATPWEKRHGWGGPVVDQDLTVVGHFGWWAGTLILLPESSLMGSGELGVQPMMRDLVAGGVPFFVSLDDLPGYKAFSTSEHKYRVVTDVDGRVLLVTDVDLYAGQLQSAETALLVIGLSFSLARLAIAGAKAGIRSLVRTFTKDAGKRLKPALRAGIIYGEPPAVRIGALGRPGNLFARVDVGDDVVYNVKSIVLKGGKTAAEEADIQTARLAHREMFRRAAQTARNRGQKEFLFRGEEAGANFRTHADNLAREIGIPNSGQALPGSAGVNYQVRLLVSKVLSGR